MSILAHATQSLDEAIMASYQNAFFDTARRPEMIFELYTHLKFKLRVYTFTQMTDVSGLYISLARGDITKNSNDDLSFCLLYLTELFHATFIKVSGVCELEVQAAIDQCIQELALLLSLHRRAEDENGGTITDFYRNGLSYDAWIAAMDRNPWLIIAILFRYTGSELPVAMLNYRHDMKGLKRELEK